MRHDSSRTEDAYHDGCRRFILFRHPTPTASFIWPRVERAERATPWEQVHRELTVRADKGDKDRLTMLPAAEADGLREHLGGVREKHARDVAAERLLVYYERHDCPRLNRLHVASAAELAAWLDGHIRPEREEGVDLTITAFEMAEFLITNHDGELWVRRPSEWPAAEQKHAEPGSNWREWG